MNRTHDAHTGAHQYADKEAKRASRKVRKAIQYSCGLTCKSVAELTQTAHRLAYDEAYGHAYRGLLMQVIKSEVFGLKREVSEAFDRFNAERDAVHVTTFEENAELVRQYHDEAGWLADLKTRAAALDCRISTDEPVNDDVPPEYRGPYALRGPLSYGNQGTYEAHVPGVNLVLLADQIAQIERERAS
jgi:hypothetical protein